MRGRLYPQPRERYERFRLNPYSPLYEGLAVFFSVPPVENILPELHGPYAIPGAAASVSAAVFHQFFPEIGRAAIAPSVNWVGLGWPFVLPHREVITLTVIARRGPDIRDAFFIGNSAASIAGSSSALVPVYNWRNIGGSLNWGRSDNKFWPPMNTWFTFSGTFRPGSVTGYLSNWGIIDVTLYSGVWPTMLERASSIRIADNKVGNFVADGFVHLRELSLTELDAISDYGNVDLRVPGEAPLILPVRTYWPSVLPVAPSYLKRRSLGARVGTREAAL